MVRGAVDLLARASLEALTLRRLTTELGVSAPTLYWHVRNERQLLDLMAEALRTVLAVGDYVIGCAVEYQAEAAREPDPAASFEHGLGLLIAGIRARHAELVGTTAAAGTPVEAG
ncbi:MAG TPA: TetR family transcriptional regulator [Actinomycetes bacterium]|nr:TetR family transcriptional regulator [Actinomycetes bacterium]